MEATMERREFISIIGGAIVEPCSAAPSSYVGGFGYNQVLPAPEAEMPQRFHRAEEVFAQKLWREELRDWDENRKPLRRTGRCRLSIPTFSLMRNWSPT